MRRKVVETLALQNASDEDIEQQVVHNYIRLMHSYFEQKKHIKNENLVEIKYEDLVADPIHQVKHVYSTLRLPGFEHALPHIQNYLQQQSQYKTNVYTQDTTIIEHVNKNWKFTIDYWKYDPPK
jgi:hypothetical protein